MTFYLLETSFVTACLDWIMFSIRTLDMILILHLFCFYITTVITVSASFGGYSVDNNANWLIGFCVIWMLWLKCIVLALYMFFLFCLSIYLFYVVFAFVYWYQFYCLFLLLLLLLTHLFNSFCCSCSGSFMYFILLLVISTLLFMLPVFISTLLFIAIITL